MEPTDERTKVKLIVVVLKKKFNNLSTIEVMDLAYEILDALETGKNTPG